MDLDRRTVFELAFAAFIIVAFTAGLYVVSETYASSDSGNSSVPPSVQPEGGLALVGVIAAFILVVAVAGLVMYYQDFDDEE